jgi:hypothetical protein
VPGDVEPGEYDVEVVWSGIVDDGRYSAELGHKAVHKLKVLRLEFEDPRGTPLCETDQIPLFNPNPVVTMDALGNPGIGENPSITVTGTVKSFIAPIGKGKIYVNGWEPATLVTVSDGENRLGPFERRFTSEPIEIGNFDYKIVVSAENALGNAGWDSAEIEVTRNDQGVITERKVVEGATVPAEDPQIVEKHVFRLRFENAGLVADLYEEGEDFVVSAVGLNGPISVVLPKSGADYLSDDMFFVPWKMVWPLRPEGWSEEEYDRLKSTRIMARLGTKPYALVDKPGLAHIRDEAIPTGMLLVGAESRNPVDYVRLGDPENPTDETTYRIQVGASGSDGERFDVLLSSLDASGAVVVPPPGNYPVVSQSVTLKRQSQEENDPAYNLYETGEKALAFGGELPEEPDASGESDLLINYGGGETRLLRMWHAQYGAGEEFLLTVDLDGDFIRDGKIDQKDPDDKEEHTSPGMFVCVNCDDDDGDGVLDVDDGFDKDKKPGNQDDRNPREDDLVKIALEGLPPSVDLGSVLLGIDSVAAANRIRIWSDPAKSEFVVGLPPDSPVAEQYEEWRVGTGEHIGALGGLPRYLYVEGLRKSEEMGDVELSLRYKDSSGNVMCSDRIVLTVVKIKLDGLRVYDPKLDGAGSSEIKYEIDGPSSMAPRVELTVMDGTSEVSCLVRKTQAGPPLGTEMTTTWDGKWGIDKDGAVTVHRGKYVDPKRYTVELKLYWESSVECVMAKTYDVHVVRLGVRQLGFLPSSAAGAPANETELTYHKTRPTDDAAGRANFAFTNNADFAADVVWQMDHIDWLNPDGSILSRTRPKREKNALGESFRDEDNSGAHNGTEWYFDADGNAAYSTTLRQVNFPGQVPTADTGVTAGVDANNFNRPAVYVRNSRIKPRFCFGEHAISDVTHANVAAGYPIDGLPIQVRAQFGGRWMVGDNEAAAANATRNISRTGGPYTLLADDHAASRLPNNVGFNTHTITFSFRYNATGESFVDTDGDGIHDAGEPFTDRDGNGTFDENWKDIPGSQATSHLIYRLAGVPTDTALAQAPGQRLWLKVVDFTCSWGGSRAGGPAQSPAHVFEEIWNTDHFWTPFRAGPRPDNSLGFRGTGDPVETARPDRWGNPPMCYTFRHDLSNPYPGAFDGQTVDQWLDLNYGRCGGWSRVLPAFAGAHGHDLRPIALEMLVRRERAGAFHFVTAAAAATGGNAVGDRLYLSATQVNIILGAGTVPPADRVTGIIVDSAISGQANPAGGPVDPVTGPWLARYFDNHALAFHDINGNGAFDGGDLLYDGSYEHGAGTANRGGYASVQAVENAAIDEYRYRYRFDVLAVNAGGAITAATPPAADVYRFAQDATATEMEGIP